MVRHPRIVNRLCHAARRPSPAPAPVAGVVIAHPPTGQFLGPGLVLTDRAGAVVVESVDQARRFLARYGSEPSLVPVAAVEATVAA
jgi:hypothetical protein